MKLAKLSLAAIAVVGLTTSSFAADTLADAFKNGKVKGDIKAYYFDKDTGTTSADIFTTGLMVNYVTDSFNGFKMGATFQSSASPIADDEAKVLFGTGGSHDMWGSGAVLSEAYLAYKMDKTTVKVGRQFISTPLVAGSGSRLIKQSFGGATLVNTNIPNTTLVLGFVNEYQNRTDNAGGIGQFASVKDAYTAVAINKSLPGVTITAQYADQEDTVKIMYGEVKYAGKASNFSYNVAAQYLDSETEAGAEGDFYAVKAGIGMAGLNASVAYSKTSDDAAPVPGVGSGVFGTYYTKASIAAATLTVNKKMAEAYLVEASYKMGAAKVGAKYLTISDMAAAGTDVTVTDFYAGYKFGGALKGLSTDVIYEDYGQDKAGNELWVKASFKF